MGHTRTHIAYTHIYIYVCVCVCVCVCLCVYVCVSGCVYVSVCVSFIRKVTTSKGLKAELIYMFIAEYAEYMKHFY